ncbi:unnamed protein product [Pylaiella littoralis]
MRSVRGHCRVYERGTVDPLEDWERKFRTEGRIKVRTRFSWVPPNVHGLKKKGEGAGIMIFGTIVDNFGFVVGDKADIAKAE